MLQSIKIKRTKFYDGLSKRTLLRHIDELDKLSILYACNGSGKSSLLQAIYRNDSDLELTGEYSKIAFFTNSKDNKKFMSPYSPDEVNMVYTYKNEISEGTGLVRSFIDWYENMDDDVDLVLLDEIDSGLSPEHINVVFNIIQRLLDEGKQVIMSCNSYHPIYITKKFISMIDGKHIKCTTYDKFYKYSIKSKEKIFKKQESDG